MNIRDKYGFEAKVIEATSFAGSTITTLQLRYPRLIHSEFMTHRVFSRNASSSRAIPVAKMIEQVRKEPAMPIHWGTNKPGMQAGEELTGWDKERAIDQWKSAAMVAANHAEAMMLMGLHKQVANRILEPFQFIHVVVTATEWKNFFELRRHSAADPNIQHLANLMYEAIEANTPREVDVHGNGNNWYHLPYILKEERDMHPISLLAKLSAARCARVSYLTHDGDKPDQEKDLALFDRLLGAAPIHASPAEHQACAMMLPKEINGKETHGNLSPRWLQFRKCIELGMPEEFYRN